MEERKKNLCAMIPESLHKKVREEQEEWGIKLNEYMERLLKDHFEKGEMRDGKRNEDTGISGIPGVIPDGEGSFKEDWAEPERFCDRTD